MDLTSTFVSSRHVEAHGLRGTARTGLDASGPRERLHSPQRPLVLAGRCATHLAPADSLLAPTAICTGTAMYTRHLQHPASASQDWVLRQPPTVMRSAASTPTRSCSDDSHSVGRSLSADGAAPFSHARGIPGNDRRRASHRYGDVTPNYCSGGSVRLSRHRTIPSHHRACSNALTLGVGNDRSPNSQA